jgi:hypothetical protein
VERRGEHLHAGRAAAERWLRHVDAAAAIRGTQRPSEVIRGRQRPSAVIRGHQRSTHLDAEAAVSA